MDINILITIIPPILTAIFAYLIARKRATITDRLNKAKVNADIQSQALVIVKGVIKDMREEFRREIDNLRKENSDLKAQLSSNGKEILVFKSQLDNSELIITSLRSEISALQSTINLYEERIIDLMKHIPQ